MTTAAPPLFATWLGYLTAILSGGALLSALAALITRRKEPEAWAYWGAISIAISVSIATIVALSSYVLVRVSDAIYIQVFLAASLFTLAIALAGWRQRETDVLWRPETRLLYLAGYASCLGLSIALIIMG